MPKTFDEKREAFQRMLEGRLPKAVKSVELLANLSRKSDYEYLSSEVLGMLDQLDRAVDGVAEAFGCKVEVIADAEVPVEPPAAPPRADGEAVVDLDQRAEVRWAYDALKRGDSKLAKDRLRRVIEHWIEEDRT
jgi:hypothetical protein